MTDILSQSPVLFAAVAFAFALLIGSFLNVVIYRLPIMMQREWHEQCEELQTDEAPVLLNGPFNLVVPRSRCPSCGKQIRSWQNIPVLSYILLGGQCASCKQKISTRYPLIEFLTAFLAAVCAWRFGFGWEALMAIALTCALVAVSMIDYDHQLLPDSIVIPLVWVGLAMSILHPMAGAEVLFVAPTDSIIGALVGYLSLWSVYKLFKLATGKEGMGYGDFKLLAALGAWLGVEAVPIIILMSAVVGATVGIALIVLRGRDRQLPIPFGPYLAAAGWITMLYGETIKNAYLDYFM
jgi:leader peptidase (prepilin peptidase)/N-methyltransferase